MSKPQHEPEVALANLRAFINSRPSITPVPGAEAAIAKLLSERGALAAGKGFVMPCGTPAGVWLHEVGMEERPELFTSSATTVSAARVRHFSAPRRKLGERLGEANGDRAPRLNGGPRLDDRPDGQPEAE